MAQFLADAQLALAGRAIVAFGGATPGHGAILSLRIGRRRSGDLRGSPDFLDVEALDHVADLDVVVVLERHAALEAVLDLADLVLEALQRLQRAFVDHHVVAQQADLGAALDHAFRDHAAGDVAGLGDAEDLADLRVAEEGLLVGRIEQADHQRLNVLGDLVDDAVVADVDLVALGDLARLRVGAHVEADDQRARRLGERQVGLADAADAAVDHAGRHLLGATAARSRRPAPPAEPCTSALISTGSSLAVPSRMPFDHLLERAAAAGGAGKLACRSRRARKSAISRARASLSTTWNSSPACGVPSRPRISTGNGRTCALRRRCRDRRSGDAHGPTRRRRPARRRP